MVSNIFEKVALKKTNEKKKQHKNNVNLSAEQNR